MINNNHYGYDKAIVKSQPDNKFPALKLYTIFVCISRIMLQLLKESERHFRAAMTGIYKLFII